MAYLKTTEDLFLGKLEVDRIRKFLGERGWKNLLLSNSVKFGVIQNKIDNTFEDSKIIPGTSTATIKNNEIEAIDKNGNYIWKEEEDNIAVPDDNEWYWVRIEYQNYTKEEGVVSINTQGVVTGVDTKFLETLRGQPNFPTRIKFEVISGALLNTSKYEVLEVMSDISALLQSDSFVAEADLKYSILGTFTPGYIPSTVEEYPFQYDYCNLELVLETVLDTPPTYTEGEQFHLARVKRNGANLIIQDKREDIWQPKADFYLKYLEKIENPLIGVEAIKWDHEFSTRDKNLLYISWSFRSSNFTFNPTEGKVTLLGGQGGKFKDSGDFIDDSFDGWRVYTIDGSYAKIKESKKDGSSINLILDRLDNVKFQATKDAEKELIITPDVEEIEVICESWSNLRNSDIDTIVVQETSGWTRYTFNESPELGTIAVGGYFIFTLANETENDGTYQIKAINNIDKRIDVDNENRSWEDGKDEGSDSPCIGSPVLNNLSTQKFKFNINKDLGKCFVLAYFDSKSYYNIQYRYKHLGEYSEIFVVGTDIVGYYAEDQFDTSGNLINSPTPTSYVTHSERGFIPLTLSSGAYYNRLAAIELGDLYGIENLTLDPGTQVNELKVGYSRQYQLIYGNTID